MVANPLIAAKEDSTDWSTGISLVSSVTDLSDAISGGSWIETGLGVVGLAAEAVSLVVDPLGTLAGYGVGWLIEHCQPLQDALDWIAGDPAQIEAYAKTWDNVAARISEVATAQNAAVTADVADWTGQTATAYKSAASNTTNLLTAANTAATAAASAIRMAGGIVAAVRETVRDLVAQTVGRLAVWAAELVFSVGLATPLVAVQATAYIAKTVATISKLFSKLAKTMAKLKPLLKQLKSAFGDIAKAFKKTPSKTSKNTDTTTTSPAATKNTDTSTTPSTTKQPDTPTNPSSTPDTPAKTTENPDTPVTTKPTSTPGDTAKQDAKLPNQADSEKPNLNKTAKQTTDCGDPVDAATGEFLLPETDVKLPGVLELVLTRRHRSSYRFGRWFGPSWAATFDMRVVVDQVGVRFIGPDGELWQFPHTVPGIPVGTVHKGIRATMTRIESGGYTVHDPDRKLTWGFYPNPGLSGLDSQLGNYAITEICDRHQNRITFSYNRANQPIEVAHSGGYRVRVDTAGDRVTGLTVVGSTPNGNEIETRIRDFEYRDGNLISVTNGVRATTRYLYDDAHRMLSWRDSRGTELHNSYDNTGRVVSQRGTNGIASATYEYLALPQYGRTQTRFANALGAVTVFEFDEDLRLRSTTDPRGATTRTDYNDDRKPVRYIDPYSNVTHYVYNSDQAIARIVRPDGKSIELEYKDGRPVSTLFPGGASTHREYDHCGNLICARDQDGVITRYSYSGNGALVAVTEPHGATKSTVVNSVGLPIRITNARGASTNICYDHLGRPVRVEDALGRETIYSWSEEGKLLRRRDPDGISEQWSWDGEGNLILHRNRAGKETLFEYGNFDLLVSRTDADGAVTRYEWDHQRNLTKVRNALGGIWEYRYDPSGQVCSEIDFNGHETRYRYDHLGRLGEIVAPNGSTRYHSYDVLGQVLNIEADSGEWVSFDRDPNGGIVRARNGDTKSQVVHHTVSFSRTTAGRVLAQGIDNRPPLRYDLDEFGRRIARITPAGSATEWQYGPESSVESMATDGQRFDFQYDILGRRAGWQVGKLRYRQDFTEIGQVGVRELSRISDSSKEIDELIARDRYEWRPDGYVTRHRMERLNEVVDRQYDLDPAGRISAIADNGYVSERYEYDDLSNITAASSDDYSGQGIESSSPGAGAISRVREYSGNQLVRSGNTRYHYDRAGRLVRKVKTRISRKPAIWHFRYNAFDQLTDVYNPSGEWWKYTYDAFGRRTTKRRLTQAGNEVERVDFVWDSSQIIEQTSTEETTAWNYRPGSCIALSQHTRRRRGKDEFVAVATDLVGAPTMLVDPLNPDARSAAATGLWGATAWSGSSATSLRFPGQIFDEETGLHYNVHRVYDPSTGRYLTGDPLGLAASPNQNAYPHNPVTWRDPLGLSPESCEHRDFAHGTSRRHADNIQDNGLSAEDSRDSAKKGSMNRPSSFFTHEVESGDSPGFQAAWEWGARQDGAAESTVLVGRLPESVYQDLVSRGLVEVRSGVGDGVPDETIFHPDSFETLNREMKWIARVTPADG